MRPASGGVIFTSFSGMASMLPGASVCVAMSCSSGRHLQPLAQGEFFATSMLPSSRCADWAVGGWRRRRRSRPGRAAEGDGERAAGAQGAVVGRVHPVFPSCWW
jgi:hypothetical protein